MKNLRTFINYIGQSRARQRRNIMLTTTLSVLVMFLVSLILTKPANSMSGSLICEYEEHVHNESCYQLVCQTEETSSETTPSDALCTSVHEHSDECQTAETTAEHEHTEECYELICQLTEHVHSQDCYETETESFISTYYNTGFEMLADDEIEYFEPVPTELPANAMNVFDYVLQGTTHPTEIVSMGGMVEDNRDVKFRVSFQLTSAQIATIVNGSNTTDKNYNNYLYYKLPEGVKFKTEECGQACIATETVDGIRYSTSYYAFTNSINGESYIVFRVLDQYISEYFVEKDANVFNCKIDFDAVVSRDPNTNTGDRTINMGGGFTPTIEFSDLTASVEKWGHYVEENNQGYAEWLITVKNPAPEILLANGYYITDDMLDDIIPGSLTVTPEGSIDTNTYKFLKETPENDHKIQIKYKTKIDKEVFYEKLESDRKLTNKATLTNGTASFTSNEASFIVPQMGKISKSVTKDYCLEGGNIGHEVYWTFNISTELDEPLGGYSVSDAALKASMTDIVVKDKSGNIIPAADYTLTDGSISFADNVTATEISVTYKTSKDITSNTAQIIYPNGKDGPTGEASFTDYKPFKLDKSGKYDKKTSKIVWTINLQPGDGSKADIYGLKLTDEAFKRITSTDGKKDLTVVGYSEGNWGETTNFEYELPENSNVMTFKNVANSDGKKANGVYITFTAKPSASEMESLNLYAPTTFVNTATIKKSNYTDSVTATDEYKPINEVKKVLNNPKDDFIGSMDDFTTKELSWTVEMEQDTGYSGATKAFVDIIEAYDNNTNTDSAYAQHYISVSQRNNINVYTKSSENQNADYAELSSDKYTIVFYKDKEGLIEASASENAKSFRIKFEEFSDTLVKIEYKTTADMTNVTDESSISFNNTAKFNNKSSSDTYKVDVFDPNKRPFTKKSAIDSSGNDITGSAIEFTDLQTTTINRVKYYVLGWKIDFDQNISAAKRITISDTFSEGFTFCTASPYHPRYKATWGPVNNITENDPSYDNGYRYSYTPGTNKVRFTMIEPQYTNYMIYYTMIPAYELNAKLITANQNGESGITVNNSVIDSYNIYDPLTAQITITGTPEPEIPIDGTVIKDYIGHEGYVAPNDKGDNNITYSIEVNPDAKDLSNDDNLILKDSFLTQSYYDLSANKTLTGHSLLNVILNHVNVYEINSDETETKLSESEYSYQYNEQGQERVNVSLDKTTDNDGKQFKFTGFQKGDIATLEVTDTPGFSYDNATYQGAYLYFNDKDWNPMDCTVHLNGTEPIVFNDDGKYYYTFPVPDNCGTITLDCWNHKPIDAKMTVSRQAATSELNLVIPDAKRLRVQYSYQLLDGFERPAAGDIVTFSNTALLTGNSTTRDVVDDTNLEFTYSNAETSSGFLPRINKLDAGNGSIKNLNASFKIAMYDTANSEWVWYNTPLSSGLGMSSNNWGTADEAVEIHTVNGEFKFDGLTDGNLYALVETKVPVHDTYTYEDLSKIDTYYFSYVSTPASLPAGIDGEVIDPDKVKHIKENSIIPVTNNRIINVNVVKEWDEQLTDTDVTAQLYWSYKKVLNGFPSEMYLADATELRTAPFENTVTFEDTYTWSGLPNGHNGKPIYYYVKEIAYSIDGTPYITGTNGDYLPFYTGNGTNQSEDTIKITNAGSLQVEKLWHDSKNNTLPANYTPEKIEFRLYGKVTESGPAVHIKNGEADTFEITAENNWIYKFEPSILTGYNYFQVEEVTSLTGFVVSYNENYIGQTGKITIINKNPDITNPLTSVSVEKTWNDGNYANRPDSLTLTLKSSTDKENWENVEVSQPAPDISGNIWTYTYENLPYRNENSEIIYYMVEEATPDGYELTSAVNNEGISSGTIKLVNTRTLTLSLEKVWSDIYKNQHNGDTVNVNIYRTTNPSDIQNVSACTLVQENVGLTASGNWNADISGLSAYDTSGNPYYYWIEEILISGYQISYEYNGSDTDTSISEENGTVVINNEYIYEPVELPSTGGNGKTIYYVAGMILILAGSAAYVYHATYRKRNKK
ncbi:MAG: Cna B-type domain-containing protein [Ruminococcus sp.]|nr:Cna B-type domain-containing protein [Ruminococcus sp.]